MFLQNFIKLRAAVHACYRANREKKTPTKTIQSVATARTVINAGVYTQGVITRTHTRAAVGMGIHMGIPMGMGMVWVWGL